MYQGYGSPPPLPQHQQPPVAYGQQPQPQWNAAPHNQPAYNGASGPVPLPDVYSDPNAFAQMYKSHLAALTFNSKPIITNLTVMAHENVSRMANVVAQCIDEHILQAHPTHRLPALYVLDSISKNIGSPYTSLWGQRIAHLFLETYRLVDQPTRVRMEELLNTWRTAGQGGQPIFGGEAQWEIERNLYGSQGPPSAQPHLQAPAGFSGYRASPRPSTRSPVPPPGHASPPAGEQARRAKMVEQIDRLLAIGTQDQYRNPQAFNPARMSALKQLKTVVQTANLTPQETDQIQQQLDSLANEFQQTARASLTPSSIHPPAAPPANVSSLLPANIGSALESLGKMGVLGSNGSPMPPVSQALPIPQAAAPATSNASQDLIKSLMAAGLLPATSGSISSKPTAQDDAYESAILSLDIRLTSADLQKEVPQNAVDLICHKSLPLQCRQCANRYPAGPAGQRSLEKHLDWHFKQGRKAKDSNARGLSRSWLEKVFDWIRGGADDPSAMSGGGASASSAADKGLSVQQEAELKAATDAWVVAPSDAGQANAPCPICKEKFQSEWNEDEEEWIWKNARKVESNYYHGSCYYSASTLSANVSNRLTTPPGRRSTDRRSRTATPPRKGTANPVERVKAEEGGSDGVASKKRKDSPAVSDGTSAEGEQQNKRLATA